MEEPLCSRPLRRQTACTLVSLGLQRRPFSLGQTFQAAQRRLPHTVTDLSYRQDSRAQGWEVTCRSCTAHTRQSQGTEL